MIVTCEFCKTKFRLDPERMKGTKIKARCSRCGSVFEVFKQSEEKSFIGSDFLDERPAFTRERIAPSSGMAGRVPPPKPRRRHRNNPLLWLIVLIAAGAGLFTLFEKGYFSGLFKKSSDGSVAGKMQRSPTILQDTVQAYFLENVHAGQIFVVKGEAVNDFSEPISFILLEGEIYNTKSEVIQTQKAFAGNVLTQEELTDLSIEEIQNRLMNREGKDLQNVHISSQRRIHFMLVYHDLPSLESLTDYSIEVVSFDNE